VFRAGSATRINPNNAAQPDESSEGQREQQAAKEGNVSDYRAVPQAPRVLAGASQHHDPGCW
jgi:hypothetical protein